MDSTNFETKRKKNEAKPSPGKPDPDLNALAAL